MADKDDEREYFQVAYRLLDRNTIDCEFSVLEAIPDNSPKTDHRYLLEWLLGRPAGNRLT